ncbi:MAG: SurA N-terminal domain-containing protein [Janthinobacterium lividum]
MYIMKILSLLIISIASIVNSHGEEIVALVNNEPITSYEFEARKKMLLKLNNIQDPDHKTINELNKFVINSLVDETILSQHALKIGGKISKEELEEAITIIEKRNNMPKGYLLNSLGDDAIRSSFRSQIRSELIKMNIMSQLSRSVTISSKEIDGIILAANSKAIKVSAEIYTSKDKDEKAFKKMQALSRKLKLCGAIKPIVYGGFANYSKMEGNLDTQDSQTQIIIKDLKINTSSVVFETNEGFKTILLCNKEFDQISDEESNYVTNFLTNKKMSQKAQKFFDTLRKKSYIKIMMN